jgi:catechol 2,3-dioxygenase-like lactoylglutathione lyase family enzyme
VSTAPGGITGLDRIAQVKLPVSDLAVSVAWYRRLLDLRLWVEIVEDDVLRGAGLIDRQGRFNISLRDRTVCASRPDLNGFDVVAFLPASRSVLDDMVARCDRLGIRQNGIQETPAGALLDVPIPTAPSCASTTSPIPPTGSPGSSSATAGTSASTTPHDWREHPYLEPSRHASALPAQCASHSSGEAAPGAESA